MTQTCTTQFLSVAEYEAMKGDVHVQVGYMGLTICGKVKKVGKGSPAASFVVESPSFGTRTFPARLVRKCSGVDGHCLCANETPK